MDNKYEDDIIFEITDDNNIYHSKNYNTLPKK